MSRSAISVLVALVLGLAVFAARPAWAHTDPSGDGAPTAAFRAASTATLPPSLVVLGLALAVGLARRRGRRGVALALLVVLLLLPFETGLHSVHHLGDGPGHAHCAVAAACSHLVGVVAVASIVDVATLLDTGCVVTRSITIRDRSVRRPDAGRAPPVSVPA